MVENPGPRAAVDSFIHSAMFASILKAASWPNVAATALVITSLP